MWKIKKLYLDLSTYKLKHTNSETETLENGNSDEQFGNYPFWYVDVTSYVAFPTISPKWPKGLSSNFKGYGPSTVNKFRSNFQDITL